MSRPLGSKNQDPKPEHLKRSKSIAIRVTPAESEDISDLVWLTRHLGWRPTRIRPDVSVDPYTASAVLYEALLRGIDEIWIRACWGTQTEEPVVEYQALAELSREAADPHILRRNIEPAHSAKEVDFFWRTGDRPRVRHPEEWVNEAGKHYCRGELHDFHEAMADGDLRHYSEPVRQLRRLTRALSRAVSRSHWSVDEDVVRAAAMLLETGDSSAAREVIDRLEDQCAFIEE